MRRLILTVVLLGLAAPHPAVAGVVSLDKIAIDPKYGYEDRVVSFRAGARERNRVTVTRTRELRDWSFVVHDDGAPVKAPVACTTIDERTVACAGDEAFVDAADGDDSVTLRHDGAGDDGYSLGRVSGGDGADILTGRGILAGGAGNDTLTCPDPCAHSVLAGGSGDDVLRGGSGSDRLSGDGDGDGRWVGYAFDLVESAAGNDVIDGGGGEDTLTYEGRRSDVTVDLVAGSATGASGERDRLAGIEDVQGGDGDDRLLGDAGDNVLEGFAGDDRIDGRAGNDYLLGDEVPVIGDFDTYGVTEGTDGADTLRGGAGDDRLDGGSERGDVLSGGPGDDTLQDGLRGASRAKRLRCGSGRDTIAFALQGQVIGDCEWLSPGRGIRMTTRPEFRSHGRLRFQWRCTEPFEPFCEMAVGVRVGSTKLTRRRLKIGSMRRRPFLIRPSRAAHRGDVLDATMAFDSGNSDGTGHRVLRTSRWRVRL
jgi:Ca2+-binding RTX toxin-like protein